MSVCLCVCVCVCLCVCVRQCVSPLPKHCCRLGPHGGNQRREISLLFFILWLSLSRCLSLPFLGQCSAVIRLAPAIGCALGSHGQRDVPPALFASAGEEDGTLALVLLLLFAPFVHRPLSRSLTFTHTHTCTYTLFATRAHTHTHTLFFSLISSAKARWSPCAPSLCFFLSFFLSFFPALCAILSPVSSMPLSFSHPLPAQCGAGGSKNW